MVERPTLSPDQTLGLNDTDHANVDDFPGLPSSSDAG